MKKIFVGLLAIAALAACQKNETIEVVGGPAIAFENAFVGNATRAEDPSYENDGTQALTELSVYGFMNEVSGVVFDNEKVTKADGKWGYANTQYWTPGNTYYFAAVAPYVAEGGPVSIDYSAATTDGVGVLTFTQPEDAGSVDVLYDAKVVECASNDMAPVGFNMNHLLSKVRFSFTNGFGNDNAYIKVTDIRMEVPASGSINLAQANWWSTNQWVLADGITVLEFGDMDVEKVAMKGKATSQKERLTIPTDATQEYVVTFGVELYYGDVLAYTNTLSTTITGAALQIGKAYDFHATIDASNIVPGDGEDEELKPIEFTVESVKDWVDGNGYEGGPIVTDALPVLDMTAVAAGENKVLTGDAIINGSLAVAGTLDGAGYALNAAASATDNGLIRPTDGAVIKNLAIAANNQRTTDGKGLRAIYITSGGTYTFENVTITGTAYAINVSTTANVTLNVKNSTLQGWTSYNPQTTATFENVNFTVGSYYAAPANTYSSNDNGLFRPYGNTTLVGCDFAEGFVIDYSQLKANGTTISFENCTYAGVAVTAEILAAHADGYDATVVTIK